ncbi:aminoglycoside 2'-N-acetyltransferase, partial [Streptomyces anulatus]
GLAHRGLPALHHFDATPSHCGARPATAAGAPLSAARGWQVWPGRLAALGPAGPVPLPEEEGTTYVRPAAGRPLPEPGHPLQFDWREGDLL